MVVPPVEAIAATVETLFDAVAAPIVPLLDPIAPLVEVARAAIVTTRRGACREAIVLILDAIAAPVEPRVDAIAATVPTVLDAIAAVTALVGKCRAGSQEKSQASGRQQDSILHARWTAVARKRFTRVAPAARSGNVCIEEVSRR